MYTRLYQSFASFEYLIALPDNRGVLSRIRDFFLARIRDFASRWQRSSNPLIGRAFPILNEKTMSYDENYPWRDGKSRLLIVMIPGLNSSPLAFSNYFTEKDPGVSCFTPHIYKKGYCPVKEAAAPLIKPVQSYADQYPDNPIVIIGHSQGAKIGARLERKLKAKKIHFISIAGPHGGSWMTQFPAPGPCARIPIPGGMDPEEAS
jgi:pimeloyl-ACP methyl ester carboxylesterase